MQIKCSSSALGGAGDFDFTCLYKIPIENPISDKAVQLKIYVPNGKLEGTVLLHISPVGYRIKPSDFRTLPTWQLLLL